MRRWIVSVGLGATIVGFAWLLGLDLTQRGVALGLTAYFAVALSVLCWFCPFWNEQ